MPVFVGCLAAHSLSAQRRGGLCAYGVHDAGFGGEEKKDGLQSPV